MFLWGSAILYSVMCCIFLSFWIQGRRPTVVQITILLISTSLTLLLDLPEAFRFFAAVCVGCASYAVACIFCERKYVFQNTAALLSLITPWTPLLKCGGINWELCIIAVALLACAAIGVVDKLRHGELSAAAEQYTAPKNDTLLNGIPLLSLPITALLLIGETELSFLQAAAQSVALLAVSALLLFLQDQIRQRLKAQFLNRAFRRWQRESRDYMNTIRSQRHDFNLHLHAISGLISSGEHAQCGEYVRKLVSDAAAINDIMPVADAVVGSMLYNMREQAHRKGSDITYDITYDMEDIVCNGFECNKIIGNLLQNAIDALTTPEDLVCGIHASIFKRRGYTVITVENRFTGDKDSIAKAFDAGYSTKSEHDGIGLPMVLRTVEQYSGRVYPEFEADKIRFVVNIPNKLNLKEETES